MTPQTKPFDLPSVPELGINLPHSALIAEASTYAKTHCDTTTYNHTIRSAYWALLIAQKLPQFANVDQELVFVSCILHDMGWATTEGLISQDKRFEVDGANITRDFLREQEKQSANKNGGGKAWDEYRIQRAWDAIALHTTPSIAMHAAPEVALTNLGVTADFLGPNFALGPGSSLISKQEYQTVMKLFPRSGFTFEGLKNVMCSICRTKPASTYDNFVGEFGVKYGTDGQGAGKDDFAEAVEGSRFVNFVKQALDSLEALDEEE
ncbi:hypothetical protein AK830_g1274 [Neonectria ditissima]|uniref:HD domain-containing protein n=1 Tax=Neonectria ditissima TaxID=78410 RepID=A0A0N8H8R2_9HYPO|nr:hypothetical protein AK830_g1274 [Neonectria ditissima]